MSLHWWHVAAAWGASAAVFGTLVAGTALRARAARRDLAKLGGEAP